MERRLILAVVLSFAAVTLYSMISSKMAPPPAEPPPVETPEGEGPAEAEGVEPAKAANGGPKQPGVPAEPLEPAPPPADDTGPQKDVAAAPPVVRETPELEVGFTSQGGAVEYVRLRKTFESDGVTPLDLVIPAAPDLLLGQIDDSYLAPTQGAPGGVERRDDPPGPMRRYQWTHDTAFEVSTPEDDVVYTYETGAGAVWRKQWILPTEENRYDVRLRISYTPPPGASEGEEEEEGTKAKTVSVKVLVAAGIFREPETGAAFQYPNIALLRLKGQEKTAELPFGIPQPEGEIRAKDVALLGLRSHYYLATAYFDADSTTPANASNFWATGSDRERREILEANIGAFFARGEGDEGTRDWMQDPELEQRIRSGVAGLHQAWIVLDFPEAGGPALDIPFYVGPISRQVLSQDAYATIEPVIQYPPDFFAPDILAKVLLGIYDFFRNLFGNAGVGVILMTLVVRGLMMPLSIRNQLSMRGYSRKIAKLKPKLDVMKKKFGHNPKRMREEQAKLYREHGVGFPTGCLMLFVQLPIFFALFAALRTEYTLRNAAFLWIADLSGPDKLIDFGKVIFDIGILKVSSINILPLMMVALSIWQQRLMPKPADEQQAQQMKMMKWLPIIFAVILYNYTAALSLYMVLSSAVSIVESRIVRRVDGRATAGEAAWPGGAEGAKA